VLFALPDADGQSLWTAPGAQERSWIGDHVALRAGDIVTVIIKEEQSIKDDGKVELSKESDLDAAVQVLDFKDNAINTLPAVKYSNSRNLSGETKYEQVASWKTTISCVVIDVKPNGNLLIEGRRAIALDGEDKDVRVRGLVRPVDIRSDNTVSSDRIANAGLAYDTEGERSYHTEKSWFEILLDWVWPF
jgi:flagellar L-ring protein precursor FlgH